MAESHLAHLEWIRQARAGDQEGMASLLGSVRERVYPFINRTLLDPDKSEDLTQETALAVLQSIQSLKEPERFWPWVFAIATSQVRQHFRREARRGATQMLDIARLPPLQSRHEGEDALAVLSRQELGELMRVAMSRIAAQHRMVLALRFYEDLPHAEIARIVGCSELGARMRFFTAKRALARQLKRLGVSRQTFVASLTAFGVLTLAPSSKATTVHVSVPAITEGVGGTFLYARPGVAAAAAVLVVLAGLAGFHLSRSRAGPGSPAVPAATAPLQENAAPDAPPGPGAVYVRFEMPRLAPTRAAAPDSRFKYWYLLPEGPDGPVLWRMEGWNAEGTFRRSCIVQNAQGRYDVSSRTGRVYLRPCGLYERTNNYDPVPTLPTDPVSLCDFILRIEGEVSLAFADKGSAPSPRFVFHRDPQTGFVTAHQETGAAGETATIEYDYSAFDPEVFEFSFPPDFEVIDERDPWSQRGWISFGVDGQLDGQRITGAGRIPATYDAGRSWPPLLHLNLGDQTAVSDRGTEALSVSRGDGTARRWPGRSFFAGLARPWMGFNAADTVRRDAARDQIWYSPPRAIEGDRIEVTLIRARQDQVPGLMARYVIDRRRGLVERIDYWEAKADAFDQVVGHLAFVYGDEPAAAEADVAALMAGYPQAASADAPATVFWPIELLRAGSQEAATGAGAY